ncbi:MAG: GatB/YqeY domain-containing protein [Clostridia bacterium]|nr:GatB/YqeY domain-containing protein [Clostridia bacterium]MDD4375293.1 GatB/YqeY domain-containing protein [Clostridia bacterium]
MGLKQRLQKALKESMQAKDTIKKDTITMLRASILQVEKDDRKELTEEEMSVIVAKEVKKRKEAIPSYEQANRQDIIDNLKREIQILEVYLPQQLTEEEIKIIIDEAIKAVGANSPRDMGKVMQEIKPKTQGKADGRMVSEIVKTELNNI